MEPVHLYTLKSEGVVLDLSSTQYEDDKRSPSIARFKPKKLESMLNTLPVQGNCKRFLLSVEGADWQLSRTVSVRRALYLELIQSNR